MMSFLLPTSNMKTMRAILFYILCLFIQETADAQNFEALWATGSAVPEGTVPLTKRPDGQFRFAGALNEGELKIMTTETFQKGTTQFLKPQLVDSYLINKGLNYVITSDETQPGWVVSFQENTYRFLVDPVSRKVTGELMLPWNEVFIAGSAFEGGASRVEWNRDGMLPFERDHDNPYVFTWTGPLGEYQNVIEPGRFKLEGQMTWGPREMHPYTQDEDILSSTQMRQGGDDTKWHVYKKGTYRIVVDLFNETFHAELLDFEVGSMKEEFRSDATRSQEGSDEVGRMNDEGGSDATRSQDGSEDVGSPSTIKPSSSPTGETLPNSSFEPQTLSDGVENAEVEQYNAPLAVFNIGGIQMPTLQKGLNIVRTTDGKVRKIYCK